MSSFKKETKNPVTGEWEMATWHDNYYGHHVYGVDFPSQPFVYNENDYIFVTREKKPKAPLTPLKSENKMCAHEYRQLIPEKKMMDATESFYCIKCLYRK